MRRVALINPLSLIPVPRALDERTRAAKSQGQPLRFRLPLFGNGGMIMGNGPNSPRHIPSNVTATASRHVLPNDLPAAVKHLEDQELDLLFDAVVAERLRRGMKWPVPEKTPTQRTVEAAAVSLNLGRLNAVRAAFKAGVTPSKIAKEFGISQADVRKVIASEGLKR